MNYVNIALDRERRVRYDYNALADFEDKTGMSLQKVFAEDGGRLGLSALRSLLWAGLKWEENGLTLPRVGIIIQKYIEEGHDLANIGQVITKAIEISGLFRDTENQGNLNPEGEN